MRIGSFGSRINDGTIDDVVAEARQAEADGFATYWASQIFSHDALTALAVVGREVPRIELGTSVVPTYPRHPMVLAQQALTVNAATGGRLCLGIGLSHQIVIESMMGMSFAKPVRHLREYLSVLGPLSRGEAVSFDGEDYRVHAAVDRRRRDAVPDRRRRPRPADAQGHGRARRRHDHLVHGPEDPGRAHDPDDQRRRRGRRTPGAPGRSPPCRCASPTTSTAPAPGPAKIFAVYGQLPSYRAMLDREGVEGPADIAIVGTAAEVTERIGALADIGVTDFAAVEFGADPDETAATRAAVVAAIS